MAIGPNKKKEIHCIVEDYLFIITAVSEILELLFLLLRKERKRVLSFMQHFNQSFRVLRNLS